MPLCVDATAALSFVLKAALAGAGEVDIVGWELKHACTLALGSNPSLLEALASPAVYVNLLPAESAGAETAVGWGAR